MRLEEFQSIVESAVSDLMTDSVPFINFIHGHGNGTLKGWLRDYIKKNKSIKADSNDTGNDGETRVVLT
jgi:DNA mismatch repair protein MutS2